MRSVLWAALLFCAQVAGQEVRAIALFPQRAVLEIDGTQHLLRVGEVSPEGVRLLAADSRHARVALGDRELRLELSQHIAANFTAAEYAEVRIPRDDQGHYFVGGAINGRPVRFMVDTGATAVALNSIEAERLGLQWREGASGAISTAGGVVASRSLTLSKISVGNITLREIPAVVVIGAHPPHILLGNSFLTRVDMSEEAGTLVLRSKY